jgi:hypothetical protein
MRFAVLRFFFLDRKTFSCNLFAASKRLTRKTVVKRFAVS